MRALRSVLWLSLVLLPLLAPALGVGQQEDTGPGGAVVLRVEGPIGPATSDYFRRGLERAVAGGAAIVVLRMDTPGGLDTAMRDIIQAILASPVPVATWVSPSGARAASAGTYILYASHVAAMAPATTLGAATPVQIGGDGMPSPPVPPETPDAPAPAPEPDDGGEQDGEASGSGDGAQEAAGEDSGPSGTTAMERKVVNDAAAYIRGLAKLRGRNAEWAERAVREAVSLSAAEALEQNVIDVTAASVEELLGLIHGREVTVRGETRVLETEGLAVSAIEPDWRSRFLSVITDPNILPILMTLGMLGLIYEMLNPGFVFPGVLGAICLLLALYATQVLPVSYAGMALILLGLAFMVGEAFVPSFGALGLGGAVAFVIGAIILVDTEAPGFGVSLPFITAVAVVNAVVVGGIATFVLRSRRRPVVSGAEEIVGSPAIVMDSFEGTGLVRLHSETWNARSRVPLAAGQRVRVVELDGLTVMVEPMNQTKEEAP